MTSAVILDLDLGNTRGKWRMLAAGEAVASGVGTVGDWSRGELPSEWVGVARIRAASVLAEATNAMLAKVLQQRFAVATEFARPTAEIAGVHSAYMQPGDLGVDRWLGIIAAYVEFKRAVVVVSAGTALTIDWVDAVGMHRGGYIIPGARLMAEALVQSTDRVRFDDLPVLASTAPGKQTRDCVHGGIALVLAGAVRLASTQARAAMMGPLELVFAGGDAAALSSLLADEVVSLRPDLVLDGLRLALP